ncbi:unnamed protein product [Didymodactylos carnosus]|uniref:Uncharacterized protein n=1 Tax=Didymodactylos carnosus TaxID=1234261 RepID=A0A8S2DTG7_9BILA|nr:unnamed protein product [Didymodactylos carnosus]CAF3813967.1 unnamed protein product [Didymodactylos carnosus]
MTDIRQKIADLLRKLFERHRLNDKLYNAFSNCIESILDSDLEHDREKLMERCRIVEPIVKDTNDDLTQQFKELPGESEQLLDQITKESCTALSLMVKLHLFLYNDLRRLTPPVADLARRSLDEQKRHRKRRELLRELINAPVDDIAAFLKPINKPFDDFFNNRTLHQLARKAANDSTISDEFITELCNCLIELSKKYKLSVEEMISLIEEKLDYSASNDYRSIIKDFLEKDSIKHDLETFLSLHPEIQTLFDQKSFQEYSVLFDIYCIKLSRLEVAITPSVETTHITDSSNPDLKTPSENITPRDIAERELDIQVCATYCDEDEEERIETMLDALYLRDLNKLPSDNSFDMGKI